MEVHRELLPISVAAALPASFAWKQCQSRTESGARFSVPSPTVRVLHSFLHTAIVYRSFSRADLSLKALLELASLQRSFGHHIDWGSVRETVVEHGLSGAFDGWMYSLHQLLGDSIPDHVETTLRSRIHLEQVYLQVRWEWTAWVVDRLTWFSAENICNRFACSDRFWSLLNGRVRLASSMLGKSLLHLANRQYRQTKLDSGATTLNSTANRHQVADDSVNHQSFTARTGMRLTRQGILAVCRTLPEVC